MTAVPVPQWSREVLLARLLRERYGDPAVLAVEAKRPVPARPVRDVGTPAIPSGAGRFATETVGPGWDDGRTAANAVTPTRGNGWASRPTPARELIR